MSFAAETWKRAQNPFFGWSGFLGTVLSIIGMWQGSATVKEILLTCALITVCLGVVAAALFGARRMHQRTEEERRNLGRAARYAKAYASVRDAVLRITASDLAEFRSIEDKKVALSLAMNDLSMAFTIITGAACRCCVKTVEPQNGIVGVIAYCRQSGEVTDDTFHYLQSNTDFDDLFFNKDRKWFVGNDLPALAAAGKYQNSSKEWKDKYNSTVVWPIRRADGLPGHWPEFLGYLCVDSKELAPFSEEFDYPVGAIVADALRAFLMRLANSANTSAGDKLPNPAGSAKPAFSSPNVQLDTALGEVITDHPAPVGLADGADKGKTSQPRRKKGT